MGERNNATWRIVLEGADLEERSAMLWDRGVAGIEVLSPSCLACFVTGSRSTTQEFIAQCRADHLHVIEERLVSDTNWTERNSEIWEPRLVGALRVLPCRDSVTLPAPITSSEIPLLVIPGEGFGTGHHESTQLALLLMQDESLRRTPPRTVLDLGTGSGILAIGAALLFQDAAVTGLDIEPPALENARENIALNNLASRINLGLGTLPEERDAQSLYDLVCANIYAEVLISLEGRLRNTTASGGTLILSGITCSRNAMIESAFAAPHWRCLRREHRQRHDDDQETGCWTGYLFKRMVVTSETTR